MSSPERAAEEGQAGETRNRSMTDSKGMHLYNVLGIDKKATDDDIKKAYRKLALRYHPDKNLDGDPEKTEKFKEVNYANAVLSNPKKRRIYDEMGETGLKMLEQFGEDNEFIMNWLLKPWFKWVLMGVGILTGCFCCCCCGCMCCCKCCCNFCCGKYEPEHPDDFNPADFEENDSDIPAIIVQPGPSDSTSSTTSPTKQMTGPNREQPSRPAVIVLPPPDYGSIESTH